MRRAHLFPVAAVLMLACAAAGLLTGCGKQSPTAMVKLCNGSHALCSRRVDQVVFPATHNSISAPDAGFRFANQATGIAAQLRGGIRGLLIDTHPGVRTGKGVYTVLSQDRKSRAKIETAIGPAATRAALAIRAGLGYRGGGKPEVYLCHGYCELGASPTVEQFGAIRGFLVAHPDEVLLISVEDDASPQTFAQAVEQSGLLPLVWQGAVEPLPTLGEMVARDQRVLFMVEEDPGSVPWLHAQFKLAQETRYDFKTPKELLGQGGCTSNRGGTTPPLFLLNMFVGGFPPSKQSSETLNRQHTIVAHARTCGMKRHRIPNLIAVDQWQLGDVVGAARELNDQMTP
jgi:hypothetical protein